MNYVVLWGFIGEMESYKSREFNCEAQFVLRREN